MRHRLVSTFLFASACAAALPMQSTLAADTHDASCKTVCFVDIGWTDITSTTALASVLFEGLGYSPRTTVASVPISLAGLKSKQIDVSLGYWWPMQEKAVQPFLDAKSIDKHEAELSLGRR